MRIQLADLGKKYNRDWIFRGINSEFLSNQVYAIIGSNGSGKSSFLKTLSGAELASSGSIRYWSGSGDEIPAEEIFHSAHLTGPYVDLPELLNLRELIQMQQQFGKLKLGLQDFAAIVNLEAELDKTLKYFSSGMKQRLKLGLALLGTAEILLLDEPCGNLDQKGIKLYQQLLAENRKERIIIIGSNEDKNEISLATKTVNIMDYKETSKH